MSAAVSLDPNALPPDPDAPKPKGKWKNSREPETPQTIRRGRADMLHPIKEPAKKRNYVVFDIESKKCDTQDAGFERPFLACFWDGYVYETFRDDERHAGRSYVERYWHEPGGCIDKMMRYMVGLRECEECEIGPDDYKWGGCSACIEARRKYQGKHSLIVSHNGGNFDNLFVLGWYRRHSELFEECEIINVQSRMLILTFRPRNAPKQKKYEKWTYTDSIALIPKSLKEIGEAFCANEPEFQKMQFNLDLPEKDPRWEDYNYQDCVVLLKALDKFRKLVEKLGGAVSITAAGTSMQLLLRKFLKKPVYRNSHFDSCDGFCRDEFCQIEECRDKPESERVCHGCLHDFVRNAYHGGRTEIFRRFGFNLTYSDVNSSYPTSMKADLPVGRAREINKPSLSMMKALGKHRIGFVECVVELPRRGNYIPPLPYRLIKGPGQMKLIFPVGRLYGVWDWIELELALAAGGRIIDVGNTVWFEKGKLFDRMVTVLYGYRNKICTNCLVCKQQIKDGKCRCVDTRPTPCGKNVKKGKCQCPVKTWDPALDETSKLMMNSGYGKLATQQIREKLLFADHVPDGAIVPPQWMKDAPYRKQHYLRADYIIPHIAAHITADARKRMYLGLISVMKRLGYVVYGDSVAADRCVVVKDPVGRPRVIPVSRLFSLATNVTKRDDGKEVGSLPGWTALSRGRSGVDEWNEIGGIIRHRAGKAMHLVSNKEGQTEVTSDHGIMVTSAKPGVLEAASPDAFMTNNHQFVRASVPHVFEPTWHDIYEELRGVTLVKPPSPKRNISGVLEFTADEEFVSADGSYQHDGCSPSFKRRYQSGSKDMHALLRVIGGYVAEGSSSIRGTMTPSTALRKESTVATRFMWSVSQNKVEWHERYERDLRRITKNLALTGPLATAGAYVLRNGGAVMPFLFSALCGDGGSSNKRLPNFCLSLSREDFMVLWRALMDGDGSVHRQGTDTYCTKSLELVSQLSFCLKRHGVEHAIQYRPSKKVWTIMERKATPRRARSRKHEVRIPGVDEYVYDLNVPAAGNFVDAVGLVLVHNTDSVIASLPIMPQGDELGAWKVEDENLSVETLLPKTYKLKLHTKQCIHLQSCIDGDPKAHAKCDGCRPEHKTCPGCRPMHKDDCNDKACTGCLHVKGCKDDECPGCAAPIKVAMKGVPKFMQNVEVFDHLATGVGYMIRDDKTGRMVRVPGSEVDEKTGKRRSGAAVFMRLTKFRTMLVKHMDSPVEEEVFRGLQSQYDKRTWLPNGDTEPLFVLDPKTVEEGRAKHESLLRGDYERWLKRRKRDKKKEEERAARRAALATTGAAA